MTTDPRPCQGDAFKKAGPRLRREDCENCADYQRRGGKCLGHRGIAVAREAGIQLESDEWREVGG